MNEQRGDTIDVREVFILGNDAQELIHELDSELRQEYEIEHMHPVHFEPFHPGGGVFMIAYQESRPVACGALRPLTDIEAEVKRMFVRPAYRRRGLSRLVLSHLQSKASELGFRRLLLETGDGSPEAIALYETSGFVKIEPFGEYVGGARSVCYAKEL